jgi:hypothetical protein
MLLGALHLRRLASRGVLLLGLAPLAPRFEARQQRARAHTCVGWVRAPGGASPARERAGPSGEAAQRGAVRQRRVTAQAFRLHVTWRAGASLSRTGAQPLPRGRSARAAGWAVEQLHVSTANSAAASALRCAAARRWTRAQRRPRV